MNNKNKMKWAFISISIMIIVLLWLIVITEIDRNSEVKESCFETNKTYINYKEHSQNIEIEYCGNLEEFNNLFSKIKEFKDDN